MSSFLLQEIEQDRHLLRRRLASAESELEARVLELQNDITELTSKLASKETLLRQWEREKGALLQELTAQNRRLTERLQEQQQHEHRLTEQLEAYKEMVSLGKSNLQEHMSSVDGLRYELDLLTSKNRELERRLTAAESERDAIAADLDEANDRIVVLERQQRELEARYQRGVSMEDHHRLQEQQKQVMIGQERRGGAFHDSINGNEERSLLSEMDVSEPTLSQECMSVYRQLRALVAQLRSQQDDDSGLHSDCSTTSLDDSTRFTPGLLHEIAQELVSLVLDTDVVRLLERLEQARREIQERDEELSRRAERLMELNTKASVCEVELASALEECDRFRRDALASNRDEEVALARQERDAAVERRTRAEVELARTRVELMQANGQLLETVRQKVELSQQLEQWQMDMQELLDEQLKNKLSKEIRVQKNNQEPVTSLTSTRRKLLSFFMR
ncbi:unnamed protein product [Acanthoscelides obtectus]|uniref:Bicaudal D-related protein homolog n=1 Tax=Acanthoscelides obtectus TaxID=200917 RepID=A0A9P0K5F4_ACAOB|nr:unnamed protein product [Acanthoscelides obtectus]CAK1651765.1 Bicaudal D-related protein homolog [Acanthoscelides obtectus]